VVRMKSVSDVSWRADTDVSGVRRTRLESIDIPTHREVFGRAVGRKEIGVGIGLGVERRLLLMAGATSLPRPPPFPTATFAKSCPGTATARP
jgi:hypothetical protein